MEAQRDGQAPEQPAAGSADRTAARTRPIDAPATTPPDADAARRQSEAAEGEVADMHARGFGSHKGTEAD